MCQKCPSGIAGVFIVTLSVDPHLTFRQLNISFSLQSVGPLRGPTLADETLSWRRMCATWIINAIIKCTSLELGCFTVTVAAAQDISLILMGISFAHECIELRQLRNHSWRRSGFKWSVQWQVKARDILSTEMFHRCGELGFPDSS